MKRVDFNQFSTRTRDAFGRLPAAALARVVQIAPAKIEGAHADVDTVFHAVDALLDGGAVCDACGRVIPAHDIAAFRDEAGDDSLPCCCADCAESEAL